MAIASAALAFIIYVSSQFVDVSELQTVRVGMSKDDIRKALGRPHNVRGPDTWHYNVWAMREQATIKFENNYVSSITCYSMWGNNRPAQIEPPPYRHTGAIDFESDCSIRTVTDDGFGAERG